MSECRKQIPVCEKCGHTHSEAFGGICVGCPCEEGGWQDGTVNVVVCDFGDSPSVPRGDPAVTADVVADCRRAIERLRAVEQAATTGPWINDSWEIGRPYDGGVIDEWVAESCRAEDDPLATNNAALIVASRNFLPLALDAFTAILDERARVHEGQREARRYNDQMLADMFGERLSSVDVAVLSVARALGVGQETP